MTIELSEKQLDEIYSLLCIAMSYAEHPSATKRPDIYERANSAIDSLAPALFGLGIEQPFPPRPSAGDGGAR